jgi:hypothetical protein
MSNFMREPDSDVVAMTCINGSCDRVGIQVLDGSEKCKVCDGDLYPWDECEFHDVPGDDFDGTREGFQERVSEFVTGQASLFPNGRVATERKVPDLFSCPSDLSGCPVATPAVVDIPLAMFNRWIFLARQMPTEWLAYLKGREVEPNHYLIEDMYFPKQRVTGTHCEAEDGEIQEGVIATVHSHVAMKAFFSQEDTMHMNHQIEMVINRDGEIQANGRIKLECGRFHRGPAKVRFVDCGEDLAVLEGLKQQVSPDKSMFGHREGSGVGNKLLPR